MEEKFAITNTTRNTPPRVSFAHIKDSVLGRKYGLSLVFIGEKKSKTINKTYRKKDGSANVLSFPYSKNDGEIFICLEKASREAKKFSKKFDNFVGFLFIHGLLHLKGLEHGSKMEKAEERLCKKFGF